MVQPLASRIILPSLGGTPSVWTTSMLFFQALLLGGYLWAHIMTRYMPVWAPPILQTIIAVIALVNISYNLSLDFDYATDNAIWWQLKILACMVGLPYFALATNAPLYQAVYREFKNNHQGKTPYALYSLSNIGSFMALIAYPFVIEPLFPIGMQTVLWQGGYALLCVVIGLSGIVSLTYHRKHKIVKTENLPDQPAPSVRVMATWCLFAFIPSSLMLGVTAHITTDIASIPLLWIIPLAFYLASFVMAFAEPPLWIAKNEKTLHFYTFSLLAVVICFSASSTHQFIWAQVALHYTAFLFAATLCHLKLSQIKPHARHLTVFYLVISFGGCLGGVFNALIAHKIFVIPVEYFLTMTLMIAAFARYPSAFDKKDIRFSDIALLTALLITFAVIIVCNIYAYKVIAIFVMAVVAMCYWNRKMVLLTLSATMCLLYTHTSMSYNGRPLHISRDIFGSLMVTEDKNEQLRTLIHGTTLHGVQTIPLMDYPHPTSYYNRLGPLGDVFTILDNRDGAQRIAALGMGIGTVACYMKPERHFDFYEINQAIIDIATNPEYFTYLSSCAPDADIMLGDARVGLSKQSNNMYDMILVDTFSSDSIPVHLMTSEALKIYADKLKQDGIIVFHVSNRYFDLRPVIASMANIHQFDYVFRDGKASNNDMTHTASSYIVVAKTPDVLNDLKAMPLQWKRYDRNAELPTVWTDDYVNIFAAFSF